MQLLRARVPLKFVAMDMVGPFSKPIQGDQNNVTIINRYSMLTQAFPTSRTTSARIANVPVSRWLIFYCILAYPKDYGIKLAFLNAELDRRCQKLRMSVCIVTQRFYVTAWHLLGSSRGCNARLQ